MRRQIWFSVILLAAAPAWPQAESDSTTNMEQRMVVPPPVSSGAYSIVLDSEERSNYLRYGLTFGSAYSDNVLGATTGHPVSDLSYSLWPTIGLDRTSARLHWDLSYSPGFTFYQRTTYRNEADQNALINIRYRPTPHVTLSARDTLQKSSNIFNNPNLATSESTSGGAQLPNLSVIAPLGDRLSNYGGVGMTYQYSANDLVGSEGSFGNLHYGSGNEVNGLSDEGAQGGSAFYSHRVSKENYVGAAYQYQRLLSYPSGLTNETQTHAVLGFYTVYPSQRLSLSFFGGPQYVDTTQPAIASGSLPAYSAVTWVPSAGASMHWQGHFTSAALSYAHVISGGGGLTGAVRLDQVSALMRLQFSRTLRGSIAGAYANNNLLGPSLSNNGHTFSATAALQRDLGEHLRLEVGYMRLHQSYNIPLFAAVPDTNREFISISYDFARPLGR